jgi:hypothetical protein
VTIRQDNGFLVARIGGMFSAARIPVVDTLGAA